MRFTIPGRLPNLNEAFNAARSNHYTEAKLRDKWESFIAWNAKRDLGKWKPTEPVILHYHFYEENKRRDKDNVAAYAMKLIQDALKNNGYLSGDGWNQIENFDFEWDVDKKNPRIEVEIQEATTVSVNIFDIVEEHEPCHVQVLRNSVTGECSIGWRYMEEGNGESQTIHNLEDENI